MPLLDVMRQYFTEDHLNRLEHEPVYILQLLASRMYTNLDIDYMGPTELYLLAGASTHDVAIAFQAQYGDNQMDLASYRYRLDRFPVFITTEAQVDWLTSLDRFRNPDLLRETLSRFDGNREFFHVRGPLDIDRNAFLRLVDLGLDVDTAVSAQRTMLHYVGGYDPEYVRALLERGADPNHTDAN